MGHTVRTLNVWYLTFLLILLGIGLFGFVILYEGPSSVLLIGWALYKAILGLVGVIIVAVSAVYFFFTRKHWNAGDDISYKSTYLERKGLGIGTFLAVLALMLAVIAVWYLSQFLRLP